MFTLLNDTTTTAMQLTTQQREELTAHVKKWANIEGDYEATMLGGIWHYKCDSGIFEDALSVSDRQLIEKHVEKNGVTLAKYYSEDNGYTDAYYNFVCTNENLQCNKAMTEQVAFCNKYNLCEEDVARECKFIEEQI